MFRNNYEISWEIGVSPCKSVARRKEVVTESETCRLQIEAVGGRQFHFPIEIVALHTQFG